MDEQTRLPVLIDAGRTEVAVPAYSGTMPKEGSPKPSPWTDSAVNQIAVASFARGRTSGDPSIQTPLLVSRLAFTPLTRRSPIADVNQSIDN